MIESPQELLRRSPLLLDTETTGLGRDDEIIEIAILTVEGDEIVNMLVEPRGTIGDEAAGVHHITPPMLDGCRRFEDIWAEIEPLLAGHPLVAYNAPFDERMIIQSLVKSGRVPSTDLEFHCARRLSAKLIAAARPLLSLDEAAAFFGIDHDGHRHRALSDADLLRRVFLAMTSGDRHV